MVVNPNGTNNKYLLPGIIVVVILVVAVARRDSFIEKVAQVPPSTTTSSSGSMSSTASGLVQAQTRRFKSWPQRTSGAALYRSLRACTGTSRASFRYPKTDPSWLSVESNQRKGNRERAVRHNQWDGLRHVGQYV